MSLRCGQCGELIRPENINEQEHLAYCPDCGEYTFDNEETRSLEVYSVRELLSGTPPASVTLRLCEDGSRAMAVRPADRSRQLKKAGLAFVVGVLMFVLAVCSCVGCDWFLGSDIDFLQLRGVQFILALFLCGGGGLTLILPFVFLARLVHYRLRLTDQELTVRAWWLGCIPVWRRRRFAKNKNHTVICDVAKGGLCSGRQVTGWYVRWLDEDDSIREVILSRDARTAQYVRAELLRWLGLVGRRHAFVCRSCGAEIDCARVDMKQLRLICPSCGFDSELWLADFYRQAKDVLRKALPQGVSVSADGNTCVFKPGFRARPLAKRAGFVGLWLGLICGHIAEGSCEWAQAWFVLGICLCSLILILPLVSAVLGRLRTYTLSRDGESVQSEVRGVLGTKRKVVRIVGKTIAIFVPGKGDSLFLITDKEGGNEQVHPLAGGLRPCAGHWLCGWLNERLLSLNSAVEILA